MKPILKWCGGKRYLTPELYKRLPETFDVYVEPFVGSGALFFEIIDELENVVVYLTDTNEELINFYTVIFDLKMDLSIFKDFLTTYKNTEKDYYAVRKMDPIFPEERAARVLFLNKLGFNGLYRVNRHGEFNVPFGRMAKSNFDAELEQIAELRTLIMEHNLSINCTAAPFRSMEVYPKKIQNKVIFIYCDPPYYGTYSQYTSDAFKEEDHYELAFLVEKMSKEYPNVKMLISNSNTEFTRALYQFTRVELVKNKRTVSCKGAERGSVTELLISTYLLPNSADSAPCAP